MASSQAKVIVLDDDPTGSQTVHSCLLLLRWDVETLIQGLRDPAPLFFILANTRALTPEAAQAITQEVCQNLKVAIAEVELTDFVVVSRSDSTLRGHYPLETDVIAAELGPFDAHFLVPAFFEGGRITRGSVHYVVQPDGTELAAHQTEFARDSVFGYHHSYLPDYVAEKTQGLISAATVERLLLEDLREPTNNLTGRLQEFTNNQCAVVDGETQTDLDLFAQSLQEAAASGKKFLFRSAASLLTSLAQLGPQPVAATKMSQYRRNSNPGVVLVGSHVQKTTRQLAVLLEQPGVLPIEVDVARLRDHPDSSPQLKQEILAQVASAFTQQQTPVIFTSREELTFADIDTRLAFGADVSRLLMSVVTDLPADISYLLSKGGITSNDVLSQGLRLRTARLLGQILPGVSLVQTPETCDRFPGLPVVLFPG
ncbi:MAG: four-carbon acid sugar kinase family protein, partial [Cyanobacteria bacterium P01_H01_bin.15]